MATGGRTCGFCSAALPPGARFCEACGRSVEVASDEAEPTIAARPVTRPAAPTPAFRRVPAPESLPTEETFPNGATWRRESSVRRPFELSAALPKALKVGQRSLVYVRFRAMTDLYESVEFVLRNGEEELCRRSCCCGRPGTSEHEVALEVKPKCAGTANVELDIVCRFGTDELEVQTSGLRLVVREKADSLFRPVINISQTQTSGGAGDTDGGDINVNFGGLRLQQDDDPSLYETDSSAFAPLVPSLQKSPGRLTLFAEGGVLQLISDRVITFGRNRENTVVLRVCGADGKVDQAANEHNLSRYHFQVECEGRECRLRDGRIEEDPLRGCVKTPSAYGTRLNGESLPQAGCVSLMSGRDIPLHVGREDVELCMRIRLFCDAMRIPQGFLLDREDGARQRICAVWREVPLDRENKLVWNGSAWSLMRASDCIPISVGSEISIGGMAFAVLPFYQTHVT